MRTAVKDSRGHMKMHESSMIDFVRETGYGDYPNLSNVKKVLVIHLRHIGDVILSEPVARVLHEQLNPDKIDFLVNEGTEVLLESHPHITNLHVIKRSRFTHGLKERLSEEIRVLRFLKKGGYDLVIGLNPGSRVERCVRFTKAPYRVGPKKRKVKGAYIIKSKCVYNFEVSHAGTRRHYVDRHLDTLRRVGLNVGDSIRSPDIFEDQDVSLQVKGLLSLNFIKNNTPYIVIHPASRWLFKCLPPFKIAEIINSVYFRFEVPIIITAGPDAMELDYIQRVKRWLNVKVLDFSGKLTLIQLAELIRGAGFVISVDTAALHIAEGVQTPVAALFGPTFDQDWGPRSSNSRVFASHSHACRPCGLDGCGGGKVSECLSGINVNEVLEFMSTYLHKN